MTFYQHIFVIFCIFLLKATKQDNPSHHLVTKPEVTQDLSNEFEAVEKHLVTKPKVTEDLSNEVEAVEKRIKAATAWKTVMKGPPAVPLCKGHNEVSLLRTVKKKGPNMGRQFYCCPRGEGKAGDPNARCDFFKWAK